MTEPPRLLTPRWNTLVVVCKDCAKRDKGPKHLATKAVVRAVRNGLKQARSNARVAKVGCVGMCPKKAITVAHLGGRGGPKVVAIASVETAHAFAKDAGG